jgi:hypothetical protein
MIRKGICRALLYVSLSACAHSAAAAPAAELLNLSSYTAHKGFFDFWWDKVQGRVLLHIENLREPFLYQSSLPRGIGSNDIGLDRGQMGATRIVEFQRSGPRILLVQHNLNYRVLQGDSDARLALRESFAHSVLWGFEVLSETADGVIIDATEFLLRDAHGIASHLEQAGAGKYAAAGDRSAIFLPRTRAFPDNSEFEAVVTLKGKPEGEMLAGVVPDPRAITVHQHHSFIRLPDEDYQPLPYDPRAGLIGLSYEGVGFLDYSADIGDRLGTNYSRRHRLKKRTPEAASSEPVEPIIYYVDRGTAEPVRTALMEGAAWWNEAFASAGYIDAFRVELLPEDVDPMDVRYNVIQWVHRSTRGWSYGSSVVDPRTGEILKGLVTLGSLRVRQDYLIAEGLLAPYTGAPGDDPMLDMSLARIRQLAAHEVGHTLGLEHNFAASTQDRASVMDYPFPLIRFDRNGELDLTDAYASGMGAWDKRVINYAYRDFPEDTDEAAARARILADTIASGLKYVADVDSREVGTAHPDGNLWDNGDDAVAELEHLLQVRAHALERFSENTIRKGRPHAMMEEVLVPVYLLHRFQIQAAAKLIGGQYFNYALRGDGQPTTAPVPPERQRQALAALLVTLDPAQLRLPESLLSHIPPRPPGFPRNRETFPAATGGTFDPLAPARSAASLSLEVLLDPTRAARMNAGHAIDAEQPGFAELNESLMLATWYGKRRAGIEGKIQRGTNQLVLEQLLRLAMSEQAEDSVRATSMATLEDLQAWLAKKLPREKDPAWRAQFLATHRLLGQFQQDPATLKLPAAPRPPPGSPIGSVVQLSEFSIR